MTSDSEKQAWVESLPYGEPDKDGMARLIEIDHDEAETELYELFADPTYVAVERLRRRYRGMFRRRMRHRAGRNQADR